MSSKERPIRVLSASIDHPLKHSRALFLRRRLRGDDIVIKGARTRAASEPKLMDL